MIGRGMCTESLFVRDRFQEPLIVTDLNDSPMLQAMAY
jgi:hypothetical protein